MSFYIGSFVKEGSIIPLGPIMNYVGEKPEDLEVRVYKGASGEFEIYQDENDNYNYEKNLFSTFRISWNNNINTLSFSQQKGSYQGLTSRKKINIVVI